MLDLLLVRHLATSMNARNLLQGRLNPDIDPEAAHRDERLLTSTRKRIRDFAPEVCYVSPLRRAQSTARALGLIGFRTDPRLVEFAFGSFEGRPKRELIAHAGRKWTTDVVDLELGETFLEFQRRVDDFVSDCRGAWDRVAVVSHGFVIRYLIAAHACRDVRRVNSIRVRNGGCYRLRVS